MKFNMRTKKGRFEKNFNDSLTWKKRFAWLPKNISTDPDMRRYVFLGTYWEKRVPRNDVLRHCEATKKNPWRHRADIPNEFKWIYAETDEEAVNEQLKS